jgi:hypothetical protein
VITKPGVQQLLTLTTDSRQRERVHMQRLRMLSSRFPARVPQGSAGSRWARAQTASTGLHTSPVNVATPEVHDWAWADATRMQEAASTTKVRRYAMMCV